MKQYVVDAFTDKLFSGNPAAICVMDKWLDDDTMLSIAMENHLSETAFIVKEDNNYHLRWFTPGGEIDLCGHATLASAYVLMNYYEKTDIIDFITVSGHLIVTRKNDFYEMEFPIYHLKSVTVTDEMEAAFGKRPLEAYLGRDLLCIFSHEEDIRNLDPDMTKLKQLDGMIQHVSAKGTKVDCVSRSFAPKMNISEDPVCGSGHCHIIPYWSQKLKKDTLVAYQASKRGGTLYCKMKGHKIFISGKAVLYALSDIYIR